MKQILFFVLLILLPGRYYAQLGNVAITSAPPCLLGPGANGVITCTSVPGATGYEWISTVGTSQSIWFSGAPGPFISIVPSVSVLCNLPQPNFEICVRAFNAIDTTQWNCVQIMGMLNDPVFLPANNPVGIPGDSGYYAVVFPFPCYPYQYAWTITGDATFNNNTQSITMPGPIGFGVNINFDPNFTAGNLCVVGLSQFGLSSDTVCMLITAPVGITEPVIIFSFVAEKNKVIVEFSSVIGELIPVRIFDYSGKLLSSEMIAINAGQNRLEFSTSHFRGGAYFLELAGKKINKQFRFVKTE